MPFQHVQKKHFLICKIPILLGAEQIDTSQKDTFVNYGDNSGIVHARVNEHGFVIRCINPNLFLEEIRFDNPELLQIYLLANNRIRTLDLSRLPKLYICEWWGVPLEEIDFSHNPDLYTLRFSETRLQEVDLSANRKLSHLESKQNPLLKTIWLKEGMVLETCDIESHTQIRFK